MSKGNNLKGKMLTFLTVFLMVGFSACGKAKDVKNNVVENSGNLVITDKKENRDDDEKVVTEKIILPKFDYYFEGGNKSNTTNFDKVDKILDTDYVYDTLSYTPEMFYGDYRLPDEVLEQYREGMDYMEYDDAGKLKKIAKIPYGITAGPNNLKHTIAHIPNYNWAQLRFQTEAGDLIFVYASYTVSDKTVTFTPLKKYSYDSEKQKISYSFSEESWTYDFSFRGSRLTLSQSGKSVSMQSYWYGTEEKVTKSSCRLMENSAKLEDVGTIVLYSQYNELSMIHKDGRTYYQDAVAGLTKDGLFMLCWVDELGMKQTYQFVYFDRAFEGFVLADETNTYYFSKDMYSSKIKTNLTIEDMSKLESMSDSKLEEIVEKKANLLADLAEAYKTAGLNVKINEGTGEIALDSTVLFDVNESVVSTEGKEFLKAFVDIYTSVVFDEKYEGFVSKIMIEGHTDTSGAYEWNLQLSQDRADSVRDFCISKESRLDAVYVDALTSSTISVGYSCDNPVYDTNGKVDMDASRRVTFRFLINLE